jgi:membrane associated rhomboid family serine protease
VQIKNDNVNDSLNQEKQDNKMSGLLVDLFTKSGQPWVTYFIIAVCVAIWAFFNLAEKSLLYLRFADIVMPSANVIWSGAYWALITSAFVHIRFVHLLFNMWWLKDFGSILESTMGRPKYILFVVTAAAASSGAQLAVSDQTGIGFSGVVYAMFGYLVAARNVHPLYREIVTKQTVIWLLGWLVLCIIMTYWAGWNIGNGAHVAGFLFGYFVGNAFVANVRVALNKAGLVALAILVLLSVSYMPWSDQWQVRDKAHTGIFAVENKAVAGDPAAQLEYADILFYAGEKAEGIKWLRKAVEQDYIPAINHLAWSLATDKEEAVRNGAEAVRLAEKLCRKNDWQDPSYIDTLAASYAEVGRWDDAVKTQKIAISKLGNNDENEKKSYDARLKLYQNRQKMRN